MKTPFACVFNKIWRLNSCFLKWRDCVSMKCFYCQIKITFLKRLLPWFWFLLDEEEFVMNLKLSSWTPSMLLETRYKILSTFIFVSSCGPRIRMARLTFIHPDFIFSLGWLSFHRKLYWRVSEMCQLLFSTYTSTIFSLEFHFIITWKILNFTNKRHIFLARFDFSLFFSYLFRIELVHVFILQMKIIAYI